MKITHIYAENYKTYKLLDLDLNVQEEKPIILVGGGNGCGKTTLFDAIYHALYGMEIKNQRQFEELFNAGVRNQEGIEGKNIVLEIYNPSWDGDNVPKGEYAFADIVMEDNHLYLGVFHYIKDNDWNLTVYRPDDESVIFSLIE